MEAIARDQFAPLVMNCGASCVDFIKTGELTFSVVKRYTDQATATAAAQKTVEIRGKAVTYLPVKMVRDVKGSAFVSA